MKQDVLHLKSARTITRCRKTSCSLCVSYSWYSSLAPPLVPTSLSNLPHVDEFNQRSCRKLSIAPIMSPIPFPSPATRQNRKLARKRDHIESILNRNFPNVETRGGIHHTIRPLPCNKRHLEQRRDGTGASTPVGLLTPTGPEGQDGSPPSFEPSVHNDIGTLCAVRIIAEQCFRG